MPFVHLSDFFQKRDSEMVRARSQVRDHCCRRCFPLRVLSLRGFAVVHLSEGAGLVRLSSLSSGLEASLRFPQARSGLADCGGRRDSRSRVTGAVGADDAGEPLEGAYDLAAPPRLKVLHKQHFQTAHGCALRASAAFSHAGGKSAGSASCGLARRKREHRRALRCFLATGVVYVSEETETPCLWGSERRRIESLLGRLASHLPGLLGSQPRWA